MKNPSLLIIALACASLPMSSMAQVRLLAASSMTNVVQEVAKEFEQQSGIKIQAVFAGSSALARQIDRGAPVDVFISANTKWADYLVEQGLVERSSVSVLASNELVLVSPKAHLVSDGELNSIAWWQASLNGGRLAVGNPDAVPAGIYAKQALSQLGVWSEIQSSLAPTNNVRVALTLVEREEAPLGIVYATDAYLSDAVTIVHRFDEHRHDKIEYPLVQFNQNSDTQALLNYLASDKATAILERFGFSASASNLNTPEKK